MRRALAGAALIGVTCLGCSSQDQLSRVADAPTTTAAAPLSETTATPATPATTAVAPDPSPSLLDSQPATLDALRAGQAQRPVSVRVPGVRDPAPVEAHTTDPVSGGLDLPTNASTVAWWGSGVAPGAGAGSVVLAAHVSYKGSTGPFTRLAEVPVGTEVVLTSADGSTHRYAVQSSRRAAKAELDRAELFRTDGPPALVLVTCGGAYDKATHSYEDNVVVTATPV